MRRSVPILTVQRFGRSAVLRNSLLSVLLVFFGSSAAWSGGDAAGNPPVSRQLAGPSCAVMLSGDVIEPVARPFFKVVAFSDSGLPVVPGQVSEEATMICRDRSMLGIVILAQATDQAPTPFLAAVKSGRVTPASWRELTEAVAAVPIGRVKSCRPESIAGAVRAEITWYAKERRSNTFFLSSFDFTLPPCSSAVSDLWRELQDLALDPDGTTFVIVSEKVALP
jgi:hypothetical protein